MEEEPLVNYREEILRLVSEGKIRHTTKYVEKQSDESLEKIYRNYIAKQLDETNEQITDTLVDQVSELLASMGMVGEKEELKGNLKGNELFKRDMKNMLSYVTPYVPMIGLACGAICLGKHMLRTRQARGNVVEPTQAGEEEEEEK